MVDQIDDLILYQDAGSRTDWRAYPPEILWLVGQWRRAETMVKALRSEKLIRLLAGSGLQKNGT